jgi:hypothetical protein
MFQMTGFVAWHPFRSHMLCQAVMSSTDYGAWAAKLSTESGYLKILFRPIYLTWLLVAVIQVP